MYHVSCVFTTSTPLTLRFLLSIHSSITAHRSPLIVQVGTVWCSYSTMKSAERGQHEQGFACQSVNTTSKTRRMEIWWKDLFLFSMDFIRWVVLLSICFQDCISLTSPKCIVPITKFLCVWIPNKRVPGRQNGRWQCVVVEWIMQKTLQTSFRWWMSHRLASSPHRRCRTLVVGITRKRRRTAKDDKNMQRRSRNNQHQIWVLAERENTVHCYKGVGGDGGDGEGGNVSFLASMP